MSRPLLALTAAAMLIFFPAQAEAGIKYYPDPVYKRLAPEDRLPMDEMIELARQGDERAQFIVGDLFAKGKGGVAKDPAEARRWFEESAMRGYAHSFIRLAALAKQEKKFAEAWQWYTLAMRGFDYGDGRYKFAAAARKELEEAEKLSGDDIAAAKKSLKDWENMRDKHLEDERKAEKEKARQDEEKQTATGAADEQD